MTRSAISEYRLVLAAQASHQDRRKADELCRRVRTLAGDIEAAIGSANRHETEVALDEAHTSLVAAIETLGDVVARLTAITSEDFAEEIRNAEDAARAEAREAVS